MNRAVFLDRDGVIVADVGYPHRREQLRFLARAGEAIKLLNAHGFKVIVVTNQAGVARGFYTEAAAREMNDYICQQISEQGGSIDRVYYCPHHIEGTVKEYAVPCSCRKPNTGMIEQATRDFGIDLTRSFLVGDKESDIEAGRRTGCRTVLLTGDGANPQTANALPSSDHIARSLYEAVSWIIEHAGDRPQKRRQESSRG
jgi:D-glycero-D-manno-heptose 1,7-bisphosphate phosphatase